MDYISNSFLMPFISLLTSILIGWVIGPDWIIGEVERNGEHFKRAGLYRFMIRYVVPIVMLILFLVSTGFADSDLFNIECPQNALTLNKTPPYRLLSLGKQLVWRSF